MLETLPSAALMPATDFETVFRDHFEPMVRAVALAAGSRAVAEDCVQEAFARAYARWRRVSRYDDPAAWIRHVALNVMRDHHRRGSRQSRLLDRLRGHAVETAPAPELPADDRSGLAAAVAALPRQQRTAVALFYVEQLSVTETAAAMGLSDGAVKYHLHAARAALRRAWGTPL
jgi:RNA polymerase sigma-70 factor (ECF subfamily)